MPSTICQTADTKTNAKYRGKGGGFELRSSLQIKCLTPGKLTLVERVQIPHSRDISVVQKNANSPPLSRKRHRSVKKRIKRQNVVNKRLQENMEILITTNVLHHYDLLISYILSINDGNKMMTFICSREI